MSTNGNSLLQSTFDNYSLNTIPLRMSDQFNNVRSFRNCEVKPLIAMLSVTQMLLTPGLIVMTVAATRMHRSLVDYASGFPDVYDNLNLPYPLSHLTRAISFQGERTGEFQTTNK